MPDVNEIHALIPKKCRGCPTACAGVIELVIKNIEVRKRRQSAEQLMDRVAADEFLRFTNEIVGTYDEDSDRTRQRLNQLNGFLFGAVLDEYDALEKTVKDIVGNCAGFDPAIGTCQSESDEF